MPRAVPRTSDKMGPCSEALAIGVSTNGTSRERGGRWRQREGEGYAIESFRSLKQVHLLGTFKLGEVPLDTWDGGGEGGRLFQG